MKFRTIIILRWRERHEVVEGFKGFDNVLFLCSQDVIQVSIFFITIL